MNRSLTIGQQIAAGVLIPFTLLIITLSPYSLRNAHNMNEVNQRIARAQQVLLRLSEVLNGSLELESSQRGYLITGREDFLAPDSAVVDSLDAKLEELRRLTADSGEHRRRLDSLQTLLHDMQKELLQTIELRRSQGLTAVTRLIGEGRGAHYLEEIRRQVEAIKVAEEEGLRQRAVESEQATRVMLLLPIVSVPLCIGIMAAAILFSIRQINRQIGNAVQHMRSSSAELQAAATQQLKGAKGQAATATEVATTMRELVSTSRQIADSAQRVTGVATETTAAARAGDHTMQGAQTAVEQVKQQVERIVTHMLDLGKRAQEIGSILDIINELAEQTNILAINATIEAAGAGDAGRRFSVVADEIRKLADRVGGSTKEIRKLIEEVRAAANTTVMVTEDGSKAVDASTRQFGAVAESFRRIVDLIGNTAGAAREIELSTKQQTTAVEQASTAIADVAQTARESESSSGQTMQTAEQLADLSQLLLRLVRRGAQG